MTDISNQKLLTMKLGYKPFCLAAAILIGCATTVSAQRVSASITDDQLKQYALVMDSINYLTEQLKNKLTALIKNNPKITEARYNQLAQLGNDQEKLKEAKTTPDELAALQEINQKRNEESIKLSEALKYLTTVKLDPTTYNTIRNAVKSDPEVKARYDKILADLKKKS
jgi:predicted nuclease with TOPRIM domain